MKEGVLEVTGGVTAFQSLVKRVGDVGALAGRDGRLGQGRPPVLPHSRSHPRRQNTGYRRCGCCGWLEEGRSTCPGWARRS